jgi:hypothetical protein
MLVVIAIATGSLGLVLFATVRSIRDQRDPTRSVWREFGLGLSFLVLFFTTWGAHLIAEWQVFTDDARTHGESVEVGDFVAHFAQSTLENWQSEFLQLFSFVVMAALFIHKGSAESKDGEEKLAASLRRIETHLGTLPANAPDDVGKEWDLPDTPLEMQDRARRTAQKHSPQPTRKESR